MEHVDSVIDKYHKDSLMDEKANPFVLEHEWGEGFALYAYYISSFLQFSYSFDELIDGHREKSDGTKNLITLTALRYLNGRALQVANEILVLMRNGYADGAYARFRTLYEISIILNFIASHGDGIAKEYIRYEGHKYHWAAEILLLII